MNGNRAKPGAFVSPYSCGHTDADGAPCLAPVAYLIRFEDWPPEHQAGSCERHATVARDMGNLERIWSA